MNYNKGNCNKMFCFVYCSEANIYVFSVFVRDLKVLLLI